MSARTVGLCCLLCAIACGRTVPLLEGSFDPSKALPDGGFRLEPLAGAGGNAGTRGGSGTGGRGGTQDPPPIRVMQAACVAGEARVCTCPDGNLGKQGCRFDPANPSSSAFGPCEGCAPSANRCGDGFRDGAESCDGNDFGGLSCSALGYASGVLRCTPSCDVDTSACQKGFCGDGLVEGAEACDGANLGPISCKDFGFTSGTLRCSACNYDTSACSRCGDGRVQSGEACDGADLGGLNCQNLGYSGGSLGCASCQLDASACAHCGNGVIEAGESCDGSNLRGLSCSSLGLGDGTLACDPSACLFSTRGCSQAMDPTCGNGVAERGEACDGKDLANLDCFQLGFSGGDLRCNPQTCRFDNSGCDRAMPTTDCVACGRANCASSIDACKSQMRCIGGLGCLAQSCGNNADLNCATMCFGDTAPALAALSMFACLVNQCGPQCVGAF
jgi:hypothetical protein